MSYDYCNPLIVEDDGDFRLLLARAFAKAGVAKERIRMATNGEEAIELLGKVTPEVPDLSSSLVILDLNLPHMSGLEVLAWIRTSPVLRELPVFMLTSSEEPDHIARAFDLKTDSYFIKPMESYELQLIVEGMLAYSRTQSRRRIPGSITDPR